MRTEIPNYENNFSALGRRVRRLGRRVRWLVKGIIKRHRHILVEIRWRLGDEIMALPLYEALKKNYPDTQLTVLCHYPELLENNPFVDNINEIKVAPDWYIFLRRASPKMYRLEYYAQIAGVSTPKSRPKLYYENWSCKWLDVLEENRILHKHWVGISTGASWQTKRWKMEHWETLCRLLKADGYFIVQLGTDEPGVGADVNLVGKTSIRDAACILRSVQVYVGCDSGLMHLARAVGTPTVGLFGPTDPNFLIRDDPGFYPIYADCACRGCWNRGDVMNVPGECPLSSSLCMDTISPIKVMSFIKKILHGKIGV